MGSQVLQVAWARPGFQGRVGKTWHCLLSLPSKPPSQSDPHAENHLEVDT